MSEELKLDYKKALEVFKDTMREGNFILAVKSALEKQIPKKPKIYNDIYPKDLYECPECRCGLRANATWKDKYCCNCGLKIDWSDTE